jgi:ankyrin repeat protein
MVHVHAEDPKSPAVPALMQASIQGKVDTIEYLLSQGADVEQSDSFGFNPLHGCAFNQQADACAMMLAHAGVDSAAANSFHEDGLAPMHRACFGDVQADTLRVFLEAGMDRDLLTRCARKHILSTFSSKIPRRCLTTWLLAAMTKLAVVAKPV